MISRNSLGLIGGLLMLICLSACQTSSKTGGRDISGNYASQLQKSLDLEAKVFSNSDGKVSVRLKILQNDLSFDKGKTKLSVSYAVFSSYSAPQPLDSNRIVKELIQTDHQFLETEVELSVMSGRGYILELEVRNPMSGKSAKKVIDIVDPNKFSGQSFSISDFEGRIIYEPYVNSADSYLITCLEDQTALFVKFYDRDFPIAAPPFSTANPKPFNFKPDKTFRLNMVDARHTVLYITQPGFYHIVQKEDDQQGGSIHYFGNHYPESKTVNDLLYPLRYITTNEEYTDLQESKNLKKSIDTFWLRLGGDQVRAKKLIQNYYTRVEESNVHFTSYIEGWKSDRGMCYTIFGSPTKVTRSTSKEVWMYGNPGDFNALKFEFVKVVNPFSQNDFRLIRSATLKTPWYRAVDLWRQGRITTY